MAKLVVVSGTVRPEIKAWLDERAAQDQRTRSWVVGQLLEGAYKDEECRRLARQAEGRTPDEIISSLTSRSRGRQ